MIPSYLVFSQHGMANTHRGMEALAKRNSDHTDRIIAADLGCVRTLLSLEPLITRMELIAAQEIHNYPDVPIRIIGFSLGGVIWTEILTRHPEWWSRVESLVLLGSPIGGAHLAKIVDPLDLMHSAIAQDLGVDRRPLAAAIAQVIPTLIIAGDRKRGSDGTVLVQTTQFQHAKFVCIPGVKHSRLKSNDAVDSSIQSFWAEKIKTIVLSEKTSLTEIISQLRSVPGMTDARSRHFKRSKPIGIVKEGVVLRVWKNPLGVKHIFLENERGECTFSGYVGLVHQGGLDRAIQSMLRSTLPIS